MQAAFEPPCWSINANDRREAVRLDVRLGVRLDYAGFVVERGWGVGYGMDVDGEIRDLDEIGAVSED